jgi:hypothetical protein
MVRAYSIFFERPTRLASKKYIIGRLIKIPL